MGYETRQAGDLVDGSSEIVRCPRHQLVAALVAELVDFFDDPRAGGPTLSESQAYLIVGEGIAHALALNSSR